MGFPQHLKHAIFMLMKRTREQGLSKFYHELNRLYQPLQYRQHATNMLKSQMVQFRFTEIVIIDAISRYNTVNGYCYTYSLTIWASLLLWGKLTKQFVVWHKQPLPTNPIHEVHCYLHRDYMPGPQTEVCARVHVLGGGDAKLGVYMAGNTN